VFTRFRDARRLLGIFVLGLAACSEVGTPNPRLARGTFRTILIDPGHGGKDNGGTSGPRMPNALREKDLTLDTVRRLQNRVQKAGFRVAMTRNDDRFIELDDRVAMANRRGAGTILVSIHYNATGNPSAHGVETYFWRADSHGLATRIERAVVSEAGQAYGGVIRRRLRLTRNPEIPCVLVECAYLTNPDDNRRAASPAFRERVAAAIADGIKEEYRLGDAGIPSVPELHAPLSKASDRYAEGWLKQIKNRCICGVFPLAAIGALSL
jgi:N-acetylmuramoyl-L-alanine amidase